MSSSVSKWLVTWLSHISPVLLCALLWGAENSGAVNNESKVGVGSDWWIDIGAVAAKFGS